MNKFYHFSQNNSGGSFKFDEALGITHHVVIEAASRADANERAERIGLYFDGSGDCPCCGNRWSRQDSWDDESDAPNVYGEPADSFVGFGTAWMAPGKEIAVHYIDGRCEWFGVKNDQRTEAV